MFLGHKAVSGGLFLSRAPDPPSGYRIEPMLEVALVDWAKSNMTPGDVFKDLTHAAAMSIRRFQDELAYLAQECKAQDLPFSWTAAKRMYAPLIGVYEINTGGRPSRLLPAKPRVKRVRENFYMPTPQLEWIDDVTTRYGFFSDHSPVPHAIEFGFRLLQDCETPSPDRMNRFPFNGKALFSAYKRAANRPEP
jgi:hypothetical protein